MNGKASKAGHLTVKTTKSDRIYYIIEGTCKFTINEENIQVETGDVVIVPKNTAYDYTATSSVLRLFLVHSPAFDPDSEIKIN